MSDKVSAREFGRAIDDIKATLRRMEDNFSQELNEMKNNHLPHIEAELKEVKKKISENEVIYAEKHTLMNTKQKVMWGLIIFILTTVSNFVIQKLLF